MADEYYQIPEDPQYSIDDIRKLRTDDPANAETVFNPLFLRILENIAAVYNGADGAGAEAKAAAKAAADAAAAALTAAQAAATAQQTANTAQQTASSANTAAANAKSAADTAQSTANSAATAAATAQQTANTAKQTASSAQSAADGKAKIASGSYTGSNTTSKTINTGFKPLLMAIWPNNRQSNYDSCEYVGQPQESLPTEIRSFTASSTGITIKGSQSAAGACNASSYTYYWAAIG